MSSDPTTGPSRRRVRVVVAIGVAVAIVAAVTAGIIASAARPSPSGLGGNADPTRTPASTAGASSTPGSPSASARTAPTGQPAPAPTPAAPVDPTSQKTVVSAPIGESASIRAGVTASVNTMTAVTGEARAPGDIAGPSVRFILSITNTTSAVIPLTGAVVNLFYGSAMTPASSLPGPDVGTLPEGLAPGATAAAAFVFAVPAEDRGSLTITLDYSVDAPLVAFVGSGPAAG